mgnify:CR=1 FL=1
MNSVYGTLTQKLRIEHAQNRARLNDIKQALDTILDRNGSISEEMLDEQDKLIWRNHDITKILEA